MKTKTPIREDARSASTFGSTVRYVEWTLLAVYFTIFLINLHKDIYISRPGPAAAIFACFGITAILSFIFPIDRPLWQRRLYIFIDIAAVMLSQIASLGLDILLYLVLAKTCYLFTRREVILTTFATGVCWVALRVLSLPPLLEYERLHINARIERLFNTQLIIVDSLINEAGSYLAASTFVILFCFAIVSEQRSRLKAQKLAQEVEVLATRLERTQIAREIHDSLGHILTTLDVQLELAQRLHSRDPEKAIQSLDIAKNLSSQCLNEVRLSVKTMRDGGNFACDRNLQFTDALQLLINQLQQNQATRFHLNLKLPELPLSISHQLYSIIKEGLTNIQKHANAKTVTLRAYQQREHVIIELEDDGIGFDVKVSYAGFGIQGMRERTQILGGMLDINSVDSVGTRIRVKVPL